MAILDVRALEAELLRLLEEHAPAGSSLAIVDSVQDWSHAHGLREDNPFRQAISVPAAGLIVMGASLTEQSARSSASLFTIGPMAHEALAQDLRNYAKFLVLHEVAHLRGMLKESEADGWALVTLNRHLVRSGEAPIVS